MPREFPGGFQGRVQALEMSGILQTQEFHRLEGAERIWDMIPLMDSLPRVPVGLEDTSLWFLLELRGPNFQTQVQEPQTHLGNPQGTPNPTLGGNGFQRLKNISLLHQILSSALPASAGP